MAIRSTDEHSPQAKFRLRFEACFVLAHAYAVALAPWSLASLQGTEWFEIRELLAVLDSIPHSPKRKKPPLSSEFSPAENQQRH